MRQMGYDLEGKDVITQGSKAVLQLLKKNVVHSYNYTHSYPYDWRTKKVCRFYCFEQSVKRTIF